MKKIILASVILLIVLAQGIKDSFPAAINCGTNNLALYYYISGSQQIGFRFDQAYAGEVRYVVFNGDGSYH